MFSSALLERRRLNFFEVLILQFLVRERNQMFWLFVWERNQISCKKRNWISYKGNQNSWLLWERNKLLCGSCIAYFLGALFIWLRVRAKERMRMRANKTKAKLRAESKRGAYRHFWRGAFFKFLVTHPIDFCWGWRLRRGQGQPRSWHQVKAIFERGRLFSGHSLNVFLTFLFFPYFCSLSYIGNGLYMARNLFVLP